MSSVIASARSFLFLPANRLDRLAKALGSGAHAVILDLEDAVAPSSKDVTREALARAWRSLETEDQSRLLVRVNASDTQWHEGDLALMQQLAEFGLSGVVVPKAESGRDLDRVARTTHLTVLPLIESAAGLHKLDELTATRVISRLVFGNLDFQADTGMQCEGDEHELDSVRLALTLASRRAGLPAPIDGVTVDLNDPGRTALDVARSRRLGFGGKLCIHPTQVPSINEGFGPTLSQREWAKRVLAASQMHEGAFQLDGQMVDAPILVRARAYLSE